MRVSIIIPTWNKLDECLRPCIESIFNYTDMTDKEIVVVANGCTDGTHDYLASKERIRTVWFDDPIGYPKAINAGLNVAQGEYIILLNNDCAILNSGRDYWVNVLMEPFLKDPKVAITGPVTLPCVETETNFLIFFCVMIKRSVFEDIGTLFEWFTPGYGEDIEFCWRAQRNGYKICTVPLGAPQWWDAAGHTWGTFYPLWHAAGQTITAEYHKNGADIPRRNLDLLKEMRRSLKGLAKTTR